MGDDGPVEITTTCGGKKFKVVITPFDENGEVNYKMAAKLAKAIIDSGSDGLVIGGTTGEAPTISDEEKLKLFSIVKESIGPNHALIAGTTNNNTKESVKLSKLAESTEVDGLLLTVPSYNKPTQDGLYKHFKSISEEVSIPCILYNVPSRTSLNMTEETTIKLSNLKNIVGIKEASSDLDQITRIISNTSDDFKVWSGNDNETLYILSAGGYGIVSVAGHILSSQIKQLIGHVLEGNIEVAGKTFFCQRQLVSQLTGSAFSTDVILTHVCQLSFILARNVSISMRFFSIDAQRVGASSHIKIIIQK